MKNNTNSIMTSLFGLTGLGESTKVRKVEKVKPYNAERFAAAYSYIREDKYKAIAEAAILRSQVLTMQHAKARGESAVVAKAEAELAQKAKNFGTDLWRKIKELIGKLIIIISELFNQMFSKVKALDKLRYKLLVFARKLSKLGDHSVRHRADVTYEAGDKMQLILPRTAVGFTDAEVRSIKENNGNAEADLSTDTRYAKFNQALVDIQQLDTDTAVENASLRAAYEWFQYTRAARRDRDVKRVFRAMKQSARTIYGYNATQIENMVDPTQNTNRPNVARNMSGGRGNRQLQGVAGGQMFTALNGFIAEGVAIEGAKEQFKGLQKLHKLQDKHKMDEYRLSFNEQGQLENVAGGDAAVFAKDVQAAYSIILSIAPSGNANTDLQAAKNMIKNYNVGSKNKATLLTLLDVMAIAVGTMLARIILAKTYLQDINRLAKEERLFLNKIKNAPTSVTGNTRPELLQLIRKMCASANEALLLCRRHANYAANRLVVKGGKTISALEKAFALYEDEYENDSDIIKIKAR